MRQLLSLAAFTGLALSLSADDKSDAAKKLNGAYQVVSASIGGKSLDKKEAPTFTFQDGKLKVKEANRPEEVSDYTVDTSKSPPQITITNDKNKNESMFGIYEMKQTDGGTDLTLALARTMDQRPKDFKGEGMVMVLKLHRQKEK